ncbi:hypothetical protein DPMN_000849 [Dreissena polymorpha]|uniref:Uncharacterized protein n=1 Tax=Dreissena polymorpha TaxID=45954 RepID=A0A9D4MGM7_DREPO|nr:hypothetical protein DPMN_000849 [Dreissena polymorpha]
MARQRPTRAPQEVNRCRKEEIIVTGNFGWVWSIWAGRPRIDRIVIRDFTFQGSCANSVGGDSGQDGRTDRRTTGQTAEITTILFLNNFKKRLEPLTHSTT